MYVGPTTPELCVRTTGPDTSFAEVAAARLGSFRDRRTILEEDDMLFHVTHTHSWDACPYHDPERLQETFGKTLAGLKDSDADVIGAWTDPAGHKLFMVVDATSAHQIEEILAPIIDLGWAVTRPVEDTADILKRLTAQD
jgi:hypothetical protein